MSSREEKIARNEALFREVNERIKQVRDDADDGGDGEKLAYLCECGDDSCVEEIRLTAETYEGVRSDSRQFAIVPGHATPDVEEVVGRGDGFEIVRKNEEEAEIVERMDSRA